MPRKSPKTVESDPKKLLQESLDLKAQAQVLYDQAYEKLCAARRLSKGKPFQFSSTHIAEIEDKWARQTKAFAPAFSRRYEVTLRKGVLEPAA